MIGPRLIRAPEAGTLLTSVIRTAMWWPTIAIKAFSMTQWGYTKHYVWLQAERNPMSGWQEGSIGKVASGEVGRRLEKPGAKGETDCNAATSQ